MEKSLGTDDWLILPALVCCLGLCTLEFICECHPSFAMDQLLNHSSRSYRRSWVSC